MYPPAPRPPTRCRGLEKGYLAGIFTPGKITGYNEPEFPHVFPVECARFDRLRQNLRFECRLFAESTTTQSLRRTVSTSISCLIR